MVNTFLFYFILFFPSVSTSAIRDLFGLMLASMRWWDPSPSPCTTCFVRWWDPSPSPCTTGCYHHHVSSFFEKQRTTPHSLLPSSSSCVLALCHNLFDVFLRLKMFILCSLQHDNCNPNNSYHLVDILSPDCSSMRSMHGTFPTTFPFTSFLQILVYNLTVSCGPHFGSECVCVYLLRCTIQNASRHFDFQVPSFGQEFWILKLTVKPSKTILLSDLKVLDVHAQCKHCASSESTSTFFACYYVFQLIGQKRDIISNGYKTHSQ